MYYIDEMAQKVLIHKMTQACRQVPVTLASLKMQPGTMTELSPCFGSCEELELDNDGLEDLIQRMTKVCVPAL